MQTKEFSPDSSGHVAGVAGRQAATIEEHLPGPFSNVTEIWSLLKKWSVSKTFLNREGSELRSF
jgi:hypothetical protein